MTHNTKPISPLRQRMIDDMTLRKLAPQTQSAYIRAVKNFTHFFGQSPDTASAEDLRRYQLHLVKQGISRKSAITFQISIQVISGVWMWKMRPLSGLPVITELGVIRQFIT